MPEPEALGAFTDLVHVYVDDVDAHHERAAAEGATIHLPPEDTPYGDRRYDTEDAEAPVVVRAGPARGRAGEWGATATG